MHDIILHFWKWADSIRQQRILHRSLIKHQLDDEEKLFLVVHETPINIIQCIHSHLLKSTMFSTCHLLLEIGHAVFAVCALSAACSLILLYMVKTSPSLQPSLIMK